MIWIALRISLPPRLAVDDDVTAALHRVADHRDLEQFFFGDETRIARHERGAGEDVEEALVIGDQHVRLQTGEIFESFDLHLDAADRDYSAAPCASDHGDRVRPAHRGRDSRTDRADRRPQH